MKILGISAFYHDSAAAIIDGQNILAAAQEERFTRKKQDPGFPVNAIKYCLEYSGFSIDELDAVVFYDKPLLKFERLLETYYRFSPKGLSSFITAIPVWLREKMFLYCVNAQEIHDVDFLDELVGDFSQCLTVSAHWGSSCHHCRHRCRTRVPLSRSLVKLRRWYG